MKNILTSLFSLLVGIGVGIAAYGSYQAHTPNYHMETPEPRIEYIYIEKEPEVITETVYVEVEPDFFRNYSEADGWFIKDYAMREGESEGVIGMLWLMYTFENRCEAYGHTPEEEWASPASESSMFVCSSLLDEKTIRPSDELSSPRRVRSSLTSLRWVETDSKV